jgi:alkaline phosphatase
MLNPLFQIFQFVSIFNIKKLNFFTYVLDATYWRKIGEDEIANTLKAMEELNTNVAKNVIIFVGDGMSLPTVTAGRIYRAQQEARNAGKEEVNGEESFLTFEKFPHAGLSKVIIVFIIV